MSIKLKNFVVYVKFIIGLVLLRTYGNIIYDFARNYEGKVSLPDFRAFEKLATKKRKAELDIAFLTECRNFGVFPKFVCFPLPNVNNSDVYSIRRRLLRSAVMKRTRELRKINNDLERKTTHIKNTLNSLDCSVLQRALKKNIDKKMEKIVDTHRKKIKNLTRNKAPPFTHEEVLTNLSSYKFTTEELELLKNGLNFSLKPPRINSTSVLATFEKIHYTKENKETPTTTTK